MDKTQLLEIRKIIGRNINYHRLKQGLTRKELAQKSMLSPKKIIQYEYGKNEINIEIIWKISITLNTDINNFFQR